MLTNSHFTQSQTLRLDTIQSIVGYTHYLLMKGQKAGNLVLDGHNVSNEEKSIAKKFQELCDRLILRLSVCKENEIADILECYDMAFRIGYQRLPDSDFMMRHKTRIIKAWKAKEGNVEDSSVFGMIAGDVKYQKGFQNTEFTTAYKTILESWVNTLIKHNTFQGILAYEKYQRLAMIMMERLDRINDQAEELKRKWYELNKVDDISTLSSSILRSYRRFISSLPPSILNFKENMTLTNQILRELSNRQDLDPYDRAAFRMAFEFNSELMQS